MQAMRFRGLTLVELLVVIAVIAMLAALLFMAIVIPTALGGLHIASLAGTVAERKGEAVRVAQRLLAESLLATNWNQSVQSGTLTEAQRQFRWTLQNDPWDQDPNQEAMRLLTVEVTYTARNRDYSVRLSTLADSTLP